MIRKLLSNVLVVSLLLILVVNAVSVGPLGAPIAKATTHDGAFFKVGIIDTGIDYDHQYLTDNVVDSCSKDFITNTSGRVAANDSDGHGTRVAGLIGATLNPENGMVGLNPKAQLCSLKVFSGVSDFTTTISSTTETRIVSAINYAADNGIKLINMSWGNYVGSEAIKNAIANHPDILFVAEAGLSQESQLPIGVNSINQSNNNDIKPYYPASYELFNIVSVTGITRQHFVFGNYGVKSVDLSAPILALITTDLGGYINGIGGTYVSTAFVTGAVSYYWGINSDKSNTEVKARLLASVHKTNTMTGVVFSTGMLDMNNLLSDNFTSLTIE